MTTNGKDPGRSHRPPFPHCSLYPAHPSPPDVWSRDSPVSPSDCPDLQLREPGPAEAAVRANICTPAAGGAGAEHQLQGSGESQGSVLSPQPQTNRIGDCSVGRPMNTNPGWIQALAVLHPEDLGGSLYLSPVSPLAPSLSGCRAEPSLFRCVPAIRREWAGAWWFGKGQGETGGLKGKTKLDSVNKHWAPFPEATSLVPSLSAPRAQDSAQGGTE